MSRKIIINISCFIMCMALILFSTPVITSASAIYPLCCNINLNKGQSDERISWMDDVDYDYIIKKMAKAKYINLCAFDKSSYDRYEEETVSRLTSLIRNLPEDYFSKVKVCYIGVNRSDRLALREQGIKCVIFQEKVE